MLRLLIPSLLPYVVLSRRGSTGLLMLHLRKWKLPMAGGSRISTGTLVFAVPADPTKPTYDGIKAYMMVGTWVK